MRWQLARIWGCASLLSGLATVAASQPPAITALVDHLLHQPLLGLSASSQLATLQPATAPHNLQAHEALHHRWVWRQGGWVGALDAQWLPPKAGVPAAHSAVGGRVLLSGAWQVGQSGNDLGPWAVNPMQVRVAEVLVNDAAGHTMRWVGDAHWAKGQGPMSWRLNGNLLLVESRGEALDPVQGVVQGEIQGIKKAAPH